MKRWMKTLLNKHKMKCEIITIGDEILAGDIIDTNKAYISQQLWDEGYEVHYHVGIRDDESTITDALNVASNRSDVVICTGGLGPTSDDFTIEVAAKFFTVDLELHQPSVERIQQILEKRGKKLTESNKKQALYPKGGKAFLNEVGAAPGSYFYFKDTHFYFLPGVPKEMKYLFQEHVLPHIGSFYGQNQILVKKYYQTFGSTESELERSLQDLFRNRVDIEGVRVGFRYHFPKIMLKLSSWADSKQEAEKKLSFAENLLRERVGEFIFGEGKDCVLETQVIDLAREKKKTIAFAESCTGGLLSHLLTNVSGSSEVLLGDVVSYSNEMKIKVLGVSEETLNRHGAVSEECALEMVKGIYKLTNANICAAITGIAGPTGGTEEKPVGTVFIAFAIDGKIQCKRYQFSYSREQFKHMVASVVFNHYIKHLKDS